VHSCRLLFAGRSGQASGSAFWGFDTASSAFRKACRDHGLKHIRTRLYTPRTNGKAERFIQTNGLRTSLSGRRPSSRRAADLAAPLQLAQATRQSNIQTAHHSPRLTENNLLRFHS
jgi:transposase InsO family protein